MTPQSRSLRAREPRSRSVARDQHRADVLALLQARPHSTRSEIAERLGLARSTVSETLTRLLDDGAVIARPATADQRGRGRPAEVLSIEPRAAFYLGIEVAHHRLSALVTNASNEVIGNQTRPLDKGVTWPDRIAMAIELCDSLADQGLVDYSTLQGVALGLPGPYSIQWQVEPTVQATPFDGMGTLAVAMLRQHFSLPVLVDHHVRFAALAELAARKDSLTNLLYLRLSSGVGGAAICDGQLIHGLLGRACEFGHIPLANSEGRICRCGRAGCLETEVSVPGVLERAASRGLVVADVNEFGRAYRAHDPIAVQLVADVVTQVAHAVGMASIVLSTEVVVLAGELAPALGQSFADQVGAALSSYTLPNIDPPTVSITVLGDEAAALGAVNALWDRVTGPALLEEVSA